MANGTNDNAKLIKDETARRKKLIITVLISVAVYILVLIIYMAIPYTSEPRVEVRNEVEQYLQDKYNEEFDIKFEKKRKGAYYTNLGSMTTGKVSGTDFYTGSNKDIEEYVYSISSKSNKNIKTYVVYAYNKKDNTSRIYETTMAPNKNTLYGEAEHENAYGDIAKWAKEKEEVKDEIKKCFGYGYTIDLNSNNSSIIVKANDSLRNIVNNHYSELETLYNKVARILADKELRVDIKYTDNETISITNWSTLEEEYAVKSILEGYTIDKLKK